MATADRVKAERNDVGKKDLRLITEVAIGTLSSDGLRLTFEEFHKTQAPGLFYTLSYCTFPLLEDVMRAVIEVGTEDPALLPPGLYSAKSHDLKWLRRKMSAPTVFEPDAYRQFIASLGKNLREIRPSHMPLARVQRNHPLLAGHSVFENVIMAASRIWPREAKYLETGATMSADDVDLLPLTFDLTRWLLLELLRYEPAHSRVANSWDELNEWILALLGADVP